MAKKFKKGKEAGKVTPSVALSAKSTFRMTLWKALIPLLLALIAFLVYLPSLKSGFVYDAHIEILEEGFITSLSNLPSVLTLKVLGANIVLRDRPGHLLYLMLNAAVWGKEPWGYHLCSNLLHTANVALLFVLMRRLVVMERGEPTGNAQWRINMAMSVVALFFALHPIATEPVSGVSFSSDLLVTFFTLLALLAATAFRGHSLRPAILAASAGILCSLAAVMCKESGLATSLLLGVFWFLFRRREAMKPWLSFLSAAVLVTVAFLAARFYFALPDLNGPTFLQDSFIRVFFMQPRLWVFMMGKLIWPVSLSADYTPEDVDGLSTSVAMIILVVVVLLQTWLAMKSRIGALGVATYWLGLATVSNFMPLYRIMADRFYYLPLAGVAIQLLALLLMTTESRVGFRLAIAPLLVALVPLTLLTLAREKVFENDITLWSDTIHASPLSSVAYNELGSALYLKGQLDDARMAYQKAIEIKPDFDNPYYNLALTFADQGQYDQAMALYQKAVQINPYLGKAYNNLGNIYSRKGMLDEAFAQYQKALQAYPDSPRIIDNIGLILLRKGHVDEAIAQFQRALEIDPNYSLARNDLALALSRKGK